MNVIAQMDFGLVGHLAPRRRGNSHCLRTCIHANGDGLRIMGGLKVQLDGKRVAAEHAHTLRLEPTSCPPGRSGHEWCPVLGHDKDLHQVRLLSEYTCSPRHRYDAVLSADHCN